MPMCIYIFFETIAINGLETENTVLLCEAFFVYVLRANAPKKQLANYKVRELFCIFFNILSILEFL